MRQNSSPANQPGVSELDASKLHIQSTPSATGDSANPTSQATGSQTSNTSNPDQATLAQVVFPIVLACDANYIPWVSVTLHSLTNFCRTPGVTYKVYFLHTDFEQVHIEHLARVARNNPQLELEFIKLTNFNDWEYYCADGDEAIAVSTYYRLLIPLIFKQYDRILYLDCDLVVGIDPFEFYGIDMGDHPIAGVSDSFIAEVLRDNLLYPYKKEQDGYVIHKYEYFGEAYYKDILGLEKVGEYVNVGVLLFNLARIRELESELIFLQVNSVIYKPIFRDQDVINCAAKSLGGAMLLPKRYNCCCNDWEFIECTQHLSKEQFLTHFKPSTSMIQTFGMDMDTYLRRMSGIDCIHHFLSHLKPWSHDAHHKLHNLIWWGCVSTMENYEDYLVTAPFEITEDDLKVFEYIGKKFFSSFAVRQIDTGFSRVEVKPSYLLDDDLDLEEQVPEFDEGGEFEEV